MGRAPSPKTRKYWKLQLDELKRFDMTDEQKKEFEVRQLNVQWLTSDNLMTFSLSKTDCSDLIHNFEF